MTTTEKIQNKPISSEAAREMVEGMVGLSDITKPRVVNMLVGGVAKTPWEAMRMIAEETALPKGSRKDLD